jgi:hypothetical protein
LNYPWQQDISRRKSYTAQFKLEVIEAAKEKGNLEGARQFDVGESSVREWRKTEAVLKCLHERKQAMRFRKCLWPNVEKKNFLMYNAQVILSNFNFFV